MDVIRQWSADRRVLIETIYGDGKQFIARWDKELDAFGNAVKETRYNADGEIVEVWRKEYDSFGNIVKETRYNADGTVAEEQYK